MHNTIKLACQFSTVLRLWLTPEEMEAINVRNIAEPDPAICHSHDFCDPNQAIIDAFDIAFDREPKCGDSPECAEDMKLMAEAWQAAKLTLFATEDNVVLRVEDQMELSLMAFILENYRAEPEQLGIHESVLLLCSTVGKEHGIGMITVKRIA